MLLTNIKSSVNITRQLKIYVIKDRQFVCTILSLNKTRTIIFITIAYIFRTIISRHGYAVSMPFFAYMMIYYGIIAINDKAMITV